MERSAHPRWAWRRSRPCRCSSRRDDVLNFVLLILLSITLAQSWNIIAGYAGQVNLGHAAFFGLGALTARTLWIAGRADPARDGRRARWWPSPSRCSSARPPSGCAAPTSRSARWRWARSCARSVEQHAARDLDAARGQHRGLPARAALLPGAGAGRAVGARGGRARGLAPRARHAGHPRGRGRGGGHRGGRAGAEAAGARALDRAGRARRAASSPTTTSATIRRIRSGRTGPSRRCS